MLDIFSFHTLFSNRKISFEIFANLISHSVPPSRLLMGCNFQFIKKEGSSGRGTVLQAVKARTVFVWTNKVFPATLKKAFSMSLCLLAPLGCPAHRVTQCCWLFSSSGRLAYSSLNRVLGCTCPHPGTRFHSTNAASTSNARGADTHCTFPELNLPTRWPTEPGLELKGLVPFSAMVGLFIYLKHEGSSKMDTYFYTLLHWVFSSDKAHRA